MTVLEQTESQPAQSRKTWRERARVLTAPLAKNLYKQRELILEQVGAIQGFMRLLMKPTNTGHAWTRKEIRYLRVHLRKLVRLVPILIVFLLPGSFLLFPILAEVLDRRKIPRE
jgi:hypothetical protein